MPKASRAVVVAVPGVCDLGGPESDAFWGKAEDKWVHVWGGG